MKIPVLFLIFMLLWAGAFSQIKNTNQKGAGEVRAIPPSSGEIYSVVIGISDYQNPSIPDLRFADKDAMAFAEYLRSPAGGNLDEDHLVVLLNEEATMAKMASSLDWLMDVSGEGDQVIIYFSGHGDVERKTRSQWGFLLTWDSPPQTYISGAYPLLYLQEVLTTLTVENKSKVLIITDACRSGKLAGSAIGGAQLTNANLARQFANEIKILSCQPDEFSIEGEEWGGGRGAFSFHLVNGLYGLADKNQDLAITLSEIDNYLEEHVSPEVAPVSQIPLVTGKKSERIAIVDTTLLPQRRENVLVDVQPLSMVDSRGIEEDVLAMVDSATQKQYAQFKEALLQKRFFEPAGSNAEEIFNGLMQVEGLKPLHNHMRRNYATALQDEAQQYLNATMNTDEQFLNFKMFIESEKYIPIPGYLNRAADLLGANHYRNANLRARAHYYQAGVDFLKSPLIKKDTVLGRKVLRNCDLALELEPEFVNAIRTKSLAYACNLEMPDSAEYFARKAVEMSPSWIFPYQSLADLYLIDNQIERADYYMNLAWQIDSTAILLIDTRAKILAAKGHKKEAIEIWKNAMETHPNYPPIYRNLGERYLLDFKFDDAEKMLRKALELEPKEIVALKFLGYVNLVKGALEEAYACFKGAYDMDNNRIFLIDFDLACYYGVAEQPQKAFFHLEESLKNGFEDKNQITSIPFLSSLRLEEKIWNELILKYFPEEKSD